MLALKSLGITIALLVALAVLGSLIWLLFSAAGTDIGSCILIFLVVWATMHLMVRLNRGYQDFDEEEQEEEEY